MNGIAMPPWYAFAISIVVPAIVYLLTNKGQMPRQIKSLIALGVSTVVAIGAVWASGKLDWSNMLATIGMVFTISQLFYDQYFKDILQKKNPPPQK